MDPQVDCFSDLIKADNGFVSFRISTDGKNTERISAPVAAAVILKEVANVIKRTIPDYNGKNTTVSVSCIWTSDI